MMANPSQLTKPAVGGDVTKLWRDVARLVDMVNLLTIQISALQARLGVRRLCDSVPGGLNFVGEWSDVETYQINDLVFVSSSGPTLGAYVATLDERDADTPPWEGVGWMKFPNGMGPWL